MMTFRKATFAAVAVMVAIGLSAASLAGGPGKGRGPAKKATGGVTVNQKPKEEAEVYANVEFNAHEAKDEDDEAKGEFFWWKGSKENPDSSVKVNVNSVDVGDEGDENEATNEAWFSGTVPNDSAVRPGDTLYVHVVDGGTPGEGNDEIGWYWESDEGTEYTYKPIVEGNLVVHTNGPGN